MQYSFVIINNTGDHLTVTNTTNTATKATLWKSVFHQ